MVANTMNVPNSKRAGHEPDPGELAARLMDRFRRASGVRSQWDSVLNDCYALALPQRGEPGAGGDAALADVYDGTAPDAVDQLAASLLSQLTPPWSRWVGFAPGKALEGEDGDTVAALLEAMEAGFQDHVDRSNFAVEIHQCFLDLVVGGTACILIEEAPPGDLSALRFTAVPLSEAVLEEGSNGRLDTLYRHVELPLGAIRRRFPTAAVPEDVVRAGLDDPARKFRVVETLQPVDDASGYRFVALLDEEPPVILKSRTYPEAPFVAFRWVKAPGEAYGRSPVMKMLPDIRTANKVVELVLKNASIAVTGIWQADDDGVINPATIRLTPGTIIPKAVGSKGLTPLEAPGRFDVSQLVLDDLRARIRRGLMADQLAQLNEPRMTATEVLERSAQMARLLGATYGRLQSELLTPLVLRCHAILRRRGEIPDLPPDGEAIALRYRSPLAQAQAQRDVQSALMWVESLAVLGPDGMAAVDAPAMARWLAKRLGVPAEVVAPVGPDTDPVMADDAATTATGPDPAGLQDDSLTGGIQAIADAVGLLAAGHRP